MVNYGYSRLKDFLFKLGIQSAGPKTMEEMMWALSEQAMKAYGSADEMFISGSALQAYIDLVEKKK